MSHGLCPFRAEIFCFVEADRPSGEQIVERRKAKPQGLKPFSLFRVVTARLKAVPLRFVPALRIFRAILGRAFSPRGLGRWRTQAFGLG